MDRPRSLYTISNHQNMCSCFGHTNNKGTKILYERIYPLKEHAFKYQQSNAAEIVVAGCGATAAVELLPSSIKNTEKVRESGI